MMIAADVQEFLAGVVVLGVVGRLLAPVWRAACGWIAQRLLARGRIVWAMRFRRWSQTAR